MHCFSYILVTLLFVVPVFAQQEISGTEKALEQLRIALESDENLSTATRDAFQGFAEAMQSELASIRVNSNSSAIVNIVDERLDERLSEDRLNPKWEDTLNKLSFGGDLRLRHESSFDLDDKPDRYRARVRLRLRFDYQLSDVVLLGAGLRTGDPDDPNSPYITLGDGFNDFDFSLDLAFATYHPGNGVWVTAGKFSNPIYRNPVYGELVWDADVNPEGVVIGKRYKGDGKLERFDIHGGAYVVIEDSSTDDFWMFSTQATGRFRMNDTTRLVLSLGYDYFDDPHPSIIGDNAGNALSGGAYVSDFGIIHPIAALTFENNGQPISLAVEYFYNHRANIDRDTGYAIGASLGETKKKGDSKIYYQWQSVEQDSVFSAFSQDDFLLQTNFQGSIFGYHYMLDDNTDMHIWGLVTSRDLTSPGATTDSDKDQWRIRADITFKF